MNYSEIQLLVQYKRATKLLQISKHLKQSIEKLVILNNDEYSILVSLREIIKIQEMKTNEYKKTINKKKLLEKITIDDLINIESYDK